MFFGSYAIPHQQYKISPWKGDNIQWKDVYQVSLSPGYICPSSLSFSEKKAAATEWQLVLVFPVVTNNRKSYTVHVLEMWEKGSFIHNERKLPFTKYNPYRKYLGNGTHWLLVWVRVDPLLHVWTQVHPSNHVLVPVEPYLPG